jgi:hypothetical protein
MVRVPPPFNREEALLIIDAGEVFAGALGQYLQLFDKTYFTAFQFYRHAQSIFLPKPWELAENEWTLVEQDFQRLWDSLPKYASNYRGSSGLQLLRIAMESPLRLVVLAVALPLTAAVIFSGGTIKVNPAKSTTDCHLPPLGDCIRALREALDSNRGNIAPPRGMKDSIEHIEP